MLHQYYSDSDFENKYTYSGADLGSTWSSDAVFFRLWAPMADAVSIRLYESGDPNAQDLIQEFPMEEDRCGTWKLHLSGNHHGVYYTYLIQRGNDVQEVCDPYARTTGVNGKRAMILNVSSTEPEGWAHDFDPHRGMPITDAIIYEVHLRDISVNTSSNIRRKGEYLGLTQTGTALSGSIPTGLDHILKLGITHLQLQPVYDFGSVDESLPKGSQYNWGYDPVNYNAPEGSFASDPFHGEVRVAELKQLIKTLHDHGLSVTMDVVYNHVYERDNFCLNCTLPGYFSRPGSNGSGCGNDTASERSMVRKYIVDSLRHWVEEYHIDGFRFDLAGLIDVQTIQAAHKALPNVLLYGEGWCMNSVLTKENIPMANQENSRLIPFFGFFNDTFRDILRGSVFDTADKGFVSGGKRNKDVLNSCFMGVTPWACSPGQSINYVSCHDNHTLFDRLSLSLPEASFPELKRRCHLAAAFTLLSQGVPFFLAGEELLRSKPLGRHKFDENSYRSSDRINSIKWGNLRKEEYRKTRDYYAGLIAFRKAHPCLRLQDREQVLSSIKPIAHSDPNMLCFRIRSQNERILVLFNSGSHAQHFPLPQGTWDLYIDAEHAGTAPLAQMANYVTVEPVSAAVLVQPRQIPVADVVAAVIRKEGKILICKRPGHKARGNLWEFPGGKVESGETYAQALERECLEELFTVIRVEDEFMTLSHNYPDIHINLKVYNCSIITGEPKAFEHDALEWVHHSQMKNFDFSPADKDIVDKLLQEIS